MPWLQAVNPTSTPRSDKLESPIHHDFSCVGQRLATCIFATTTGEITLPAGIRERLRGRILGDGGRHALAIDTDPNKKPPYKPIQSPRERTQDLYALIFVVSKKG